jgi:magnesium transporter
MIQSHEMIVEDINSKQIIFATLENKSLYNWLVNELKLPSQVFEDIQEEDQSISYEEYEDIKLSIAKYLIFDKQEYLFYEEFNIAIMSVNNILLIICNNKDILIELSKAFAKRHKKSDTIDYATYVVLDILIDNLIFHTNTIDSVFEKLEKDILEEEVLEKKLQRDVYFARRTLHKITKLSVQVGVSVNKFYNNLPQKEKKLLKYEFIDIKEHIHFLVGESNELLDRTGYLLNLHMGMMSNKMNQAMQKLASISLMFLPLTFIVGNYGMNFPNVPELSFKYGYIYVTLLNIVVASGIYLWLRSKRWI